MPPPRRSARRSTRRSTTSNPKKAKKSVKNTEDLFAGLQTFNVSPDEGKKCVLLTYERRFNSRGEAITLQSGSRSDFDEEMEMEDESLEAALVLTRYYNSSRNLDSTQLKINSPHIRAALKAVVVTYPGVNINSDGPILMNDAPWCLFHYREELNHYASRLRDKEEKEHLRFCLQYIAKVLQKEIESFDGMEKLGNGANGLEFENIWMAFKPGTLLYSKFRNIVWISRFKQMNKIVDGEDLDGPPIWETRSESLHCDGKNLRLCANRTLIHHYEGYKPFTELEIFPLHYHPDHQSLRKQFRERGKKFVSLLDVHHCMYDGIAWMTSYSEPNNGTSCKIRGRIMVDHNEGPNVEYDLIPNRKTVQIDLDEHFKLSDDELMICVPIVPGFALATKRWGLFDVSILETVRYNKAAFESLVLPPDVKTTLTAVVKFQGIEPQFDDVIVGKGRGLIILLHGCPGVGKTLTAESIADYSERPLYTLGKADFGHPFLDSPEKILTAALDRAAKWKAIVLLDEADVFMQERSMTEMSRNEQVSILLRTLEYFQGIMFLTTNRVQTIDPAFKSRIHLSLAYPTLSTTARRKIWETFILKATEQQRPRWLTKKFLDNMSREEVNGREIKNIVRVAHALALSDKRAMRTDDLLHGLQSRKDFERDFSQAVGKKRQLEDEKVVSASKHQKVLERQYNEDKQAETIQAQRTPSTWKSWVW